MPVRARRRPRGEAASGGIGSGRKSSPGRFARAEERGGCATSGDAGALQVEVDAFVESALAALPAPPPDPLPCTNGGREVAGRCWYEGAFSKSCDQVCANASRTYDPATESFAGSGGSDANCGMVF
jgi:hypothetical protein